MFLTHKNSQIFPLPSPNPSRLPSTHKPFDETLARRLASLLAALAGPTSPAVSLSALAHAVDLLSATLSSFSLLLSDPALSPDAAALSSHLDASAALLDAANSLSSLLSLLSRRRLHLSLSLLLLSRHPLTPALALRALASLSEWRRRSPSNSGIAARRLIRGDPPRGKASAVRRAIYAVEAVSALVVAIVASFLGEKADLEEIRVPGDFPWSAAFNGVVTAVGGRTGSLAAEIGAVDESVSQLTAAIDGGDELRSATEETGRRTEELTAGLDRLGDAVNGMFRAGLCARDAALQGFRVGPRTCK